MRITTRTILFLALAIANAVALTQDAAPSSAVATAPPAASAKSTPIRVLIVVMAAWEQPAGVWKGEAERWVQGYELTRKLPVPGLTQPLLCNGKGICLSIVGEGPVAAAASMMALGIFPGIDLSRTYFLVAGIAGTPPQVATLGSVAWADWVVDADSVAAVDRADLPDGWSFERFRFGCSEPWCETGWGLGAFQLNPALVKRAVSLSAATPLLDSEKARSYRALYTKDEPARQGPSVLSCSSLAGATYWHGPRLSEWARWWVERWTHGSGRYCMTNEEDFAIVATLSRLSSLGRVDLQRVLVLRGASNFDQPHPGQPAIQSLQASANTDGFRLAIENVYRVGRVFVQDVLEHWPAREGAVAEAP